MAETNEVLRGLEIVTATIEAVERRDLAAADRYLAPDCRIRPAVLFAAPGEPETFRSFGERFASMDEHCVSWMVRLVAVEPIDETRFLVRSILDIQREGDVSLASLGGAIVECSGGQIHWVLSFDHVADAEAAVRLLGLQPGNAGRRGTIG